jgi:uncharacterized spore protein YtfJ
MAATSRKGLKVMTQHASEAGILDSVREIVDGASAGRVFGAPVSHGGVVVLPAAKVSGGAGGGSGTAGNGQEPGGTGGGFGVSAKALGVFIIREDGKVRWQPAIDINKIVMGGQIVAVTALLVARAFIKARAGRGDWRRGTARWTARTRQTRPHHR